MEILNVKLTGEGPAMMASDRLSNPLDPLNVDIKRLTKKRNRTTEDEIELNRLKFIGSLYYAEDIGPYFPGVNLWASIRDAARLSKQGKNIERGVLVLTDKMALQYDGPRDPDALYNDVRFCDIRPAVASGRRIVACRPIFKDWSCEAQIAYAPDLIDRIDLEAITNDAGMKTRIGTYRQRYGRYTVEFLNGH